jgi:hypothetical protein
MKIFSEPEIIAKVRESKYCTFVDGNLVLWWVSDATRTETPLRKLRILLKGRKNSMLHVKSLNVYKFLIVFRVFHFPTVRYS